MPPAPRIVLCGVGVVAVLAGLGHWVSRRSSKAGAAATSLPGESGARRGRLPLSVADARDVGASEARAWHFPRGVSSVLAAYGLGEPDADTVPTAEATRLLVAALRAHFAAVPSDIAVAVEEALRAAVRSDTFVAEVVMVAAGGTDPGRSHLRARPLPEDRTAGVLLVRAFGQADALALNEDPVAGGQTASGWDRGIVRIGRPFDDAADLRALAAWYEAAPPPSDSVRAEVLMACVLALESSVVVDMVRASLAGGGREREVAEALAQLASTGNGVRAAAYREMLLAHLEATGRPGDSLRIAVRAALASGGPPPADVLRIAESGSIAERVALLEALASGMGEWPTLDLGWPEDLARRAVADPSPRVAAQAMHFLVNAWTHRGYATAVDEDAFFEILASPTMHEVCVDGAAGALVRAAVGPPGRMAALRARIEGVMVPGAVPARGRRAMEAALTQWEARGSEEFRAWVSGIRSRRAAETR